MEDVPRLKARILALTRALETAGKALEVGVEVLTGEDAFPKTSKRLADALVVVTVALSESP